MKTRTITQYRQVAHTVDGVTRTVTEPYTVAIPVPPRDWDRVILTAVTLFAAAMVTASVAWSTASVGSLLSRAVIAPVAYTAAGVFDGAWILCLAVEWLSRYDRRKVVLPQWGGHLALLLAMVAVGANGWLSGSVAVGLVGATISAIAKGGWTIVMKFYAKPLDALTEQWVEQELSQAGARLAMLPVRRQLARAEGLLQAERTALQPETVDVIHGSPAPEPLAVDRADGTVRSAVRAAADTMPDASPDEIVEQLARIGITVTTDSVEHVLAVSGIASGPTSQSYERPGDAHQSAHHDAPQTSTVPEIAKSAAILAAASALGTDAKPSQIVDLVRAQHGLDVEANYVRTVLSREAKKNGGYL